MRKSENSTLEKPKIIWREKPKRKKHFWLISFAVISLFVLAFAALKYHQAVEVDEKGNIIGISEAQKEKFLADSLKMTKCVQYALLADTTDFYPDCNKGLVFLHEGEVWKYGITCEETPQNRYKKDFLGKNKLYFLAQFAGSKTACELEEKRKLYLYPTLPENVKRKLEKRLLLPPGNCQTR